SEGRRTLQRRVESLNWRVDHTGADAGAAYLSLHRAPDAGWSRAGGGRRTWREPSLTRRVQRPVLLAAVSLQRRAPYHHLRACRSHLWHAHHHTDAGPRHAYLP